MWSVRQNQREKLSLWVVIYMLVVKLCGLVDRVTTNETTIIALPTNGFIDHLSAALSMDRSEEVTT
jgi:hypothetical protein